MPIDITQLKNQIAEKIPLTLYQSRIVLDCLKFTQELNEKQAEKIKRLEQRLPKNDIEETMDRAIDNAG